MILFKNKFSIFILILLSFLNTSLNNANATKLKKPILVVDKCPEFCPKPSISTKPSKPSKPLKPPKPPTPTTQVCTQALIPVPNRPGYWYTNGCKKTIIGETKIKNVIK
jgi:hypothetical protein